MIDWNDYYYFALIADEGSYSQAALRAGVSKSVLSRRMAASGPDGGRGTVCCRVSGAGGSGGTGQSGGDGRPGKPTGNAARQRAGIYG